MRIVPSSVWERECDVCERRFRVGVVVQRRLTWWNICSACVSRMDDAAHAANNRASKRVAKRAAR